MSEHEAATGDRELVLRPAHDVTHSLHLAAFRECVGDALRGRRYRMGDAAEDEAAVRQALAQASRACSARMARIYGWSAPGEIPGPVREFEAPDPPSAADGGTTHYLDEACTPQDHHPCDVNVTVGYVEQLTEQEGLDVPAFRELLREGYRDDAQVVAALQAVREAAPTAELREEIDAAIGYVAAADTATA